MAYLLAVSALLGSACGQQAGRRKPERPMPLPLHVCGDTGCELEPANATLDANLRRLYNRRSLESCYTELGWDLSYCPNAQSCAQSCSFDTVDEAAYKDRYGVHSVSGGIQMSFKAAESKGSRLYVMDSPETYKLFRLKNRELSIDVDVGTLDCGLRGAAYLVGMDQQGWKGLGFDNAGAMFGTGYCDSQCNSDVKVVKDVANMALDQGACCAEIDIFEGNQWSHQVTMHPCTNAEPAVCTGSTCGDDRRGERYLGICDKDGCGINPGRMGFRDFFAPQGKKLNSSQPFTVVTQFITNDGTDEGDLKRVTQFYLQNGQRLDRLSKDTGLSISNDFCSALKANFFSQARDASQSQGEFDQFSAMGGLSMLGKALERGMVLALSISDDPETNMRWLDSEEPAGLDSSVAGVYRGPCSPSLTNEKIEATAAKAAVKFTNIRYGTIGSTQASISENHVMQ